eukprot:scaffold186528_cov48-Attheya_sp.AAC.1
MLLMCCFPVFILVSYPQQKDSRDSKENKRKYAHKLCFAPVRPINVALNAAAVAVSVCIDIVPTVLIQFGRYAGIVPVLVLCPSIKERQSFVTNETLYAVPRCRFGSSRFCALSSSFSEELGLEHCFSRGRAAHWLLALILSGVVDSTIYLLELVIVRQASSSFFKLFQASSSFFKLFQASSSFFKLFQENSSFSIAKSQAFLSPKRKMW